MEGYPAPSPKDEGAASVPGTDLGGEKEVIPGASAADVAPVPPSVLRTSQEIGRDNEQASPS